MNGRTRQLLGLLAEPGVGTILKACAEAEQTLNDLQQRTGASKTVLKEKTRLLVAFSLLETASSQVHNGRPAASWRAVNVEELVTLEEHIDAFAKALSRATERMVDQPSAQRNLRVVDGEAG